jgi:hypothetical protein
LLQIFWIPTWMRMTPLLLGLLVSGLWAEGVGGQEAGARRAENRVSGKLTTTEEQALYGVAILRAEPREGAAVLGKLAPGLGVTVFPDRSPEGWWSVRLAPKGEQPEIFGYVPRSFVHWAQGPFDDVPGDHWAASALERLKKEKQLPLRGGTHFRGSQSLTRYDLAVILDRALIRLRKTRKGLETQMAELPARMEEAAEQARRADRLVPQLDALGREEAALRGELELLTGKLDLQDQRLSGTAEELDRSRIREGDQDRRLEELRRVTTQLEGEVANYRSQHAAELAESPAGLDLTLREAGEQLETMALRMHLTLVRLEMLENRKPPAGS